MNFYVVFFKFLYFFQCDLNRDGKITEDEFIKAGLSIAELFEFEESDD